MAKGGRTPRPGGLFRLGAAILKAEAAGKTFAAKRARRRAALQSTSLTRSIERRQFDALCRRLGIPTSEPEEVRWALVGRQLAREQPEFTQPRRKRGRPKGPTGLRRDEEIVDTIEEVAARRGLEFDTVLSHAVPVLMDEGVLAQADRTTHPKRLRRLRAARRAKVRDGLVRALMGGRDK